jgi:molybdopterin biosynthesis enzyme
MDGYAVRAADVFGAGESNPAYLDCVMDVPIGVLPDRSLPARSCARIVTGGMIPDGADAVVMVEHTLDMGADTVEFRNPPPRATMSCTRARTPWPDRRPCPPADACGPRKSASWPPSA